MLSLDWVVTAAHCIGSRDPRQYTMIFGQHDSRASESTRVVRSPSPRRKGGAQKCRASRVIVHSAYETRSQANDVALLKVDRSSCTKTLALSRAIQPICLPDDGDEFGNVNVFAMVSGWGATSCECEYPSTTHMVDICLQPADRSRAS